jgi:hypothetical protein
MSPLFSDEEIRFLVVVLLVLLLAAVVQSILTTPTLKLL